MQISCFDHAVGSNGSSGERDRTELAQFDSHEFELVGYSKAKSDDVCDLALEAMRRIETYFTRYDVTV
jgi:hypothetical protein